MLADRSAARRCRNGVLSGGRLCRERRKAESASFEITQPMLDRRILRSRTWAGIAYRP